MKTRGENCEEDEAEDEDTADEDEADLDKDKNGNVDGAKDDSAAALDEEEADVWQFQGFFRAGVRRPGRDGMPRGRGKRRTREEEPT